MESNEKKSFKVWFEEVFWYHYKWPFLLGVFFVALIIFIAIESSGEPEYDITVVFVQDGSIATSVTDEMADFFAEAVGDLNGDGTARAAVYSIDLSNEENGELNQQWAYLYLMDEDVVLFILDDYSSSVYCSAGYFDPLAVYGVEPDETFSTRVQVNDTALFEQVGLDHVEFYACINDWTTVNKGKQENTDAAITAIKAILASS